jgi:hypothetical protein
MAWIKGQSGNPTGKPKGAINPHKKEVREIFAQAAPGLLELAIKRAYGYTENGKKVPGDNLILKELIRKALPDKIETDLRLLNMSPQELDDKLRELAQSAGASQDTSDTDS